jgi:LacI family transcriptional regulator
MATIHDVARMAGVSIATVSRVLNGATTVNRDAAERVRASVEALQYNPNHAARTLRANRAKIIGLLVTDIRNPFFTSLIRGVEDVTQREGYSLILCNSDENAQKERQYIEMLCSERVAGTIIVCTNERQHASQLLRARGIPVVAVDRRVDDSYVDNVLVDNVRGAREAVTHLIQNGYRRIGLLTGPQSTTTGRERLDGYKQALEAAGIAFDPSLVRIGPFTAETARQMTEELLAVVPGIDALFAANNMLSLGMLESLHYHEIRVPDDIGVVGFDELPWAALSSIALTTVTQPAYELGSTAAARLFQRLHHSEPFSRQEIVLTPTLCVRASSRKVRAATVVT